LIVIEKPIVLTGPIGRWLNPLVRTRPDLTGLSA